jgi:hypothetical protein
MAQDASRCRDVIADLENQKNHLEENLTKVIDNATERVRDAQQECERQVCFDVDSGVDHKFC